jgi:hypothetical protein
MSSPTSYDTSVSEISYTCDREYRAIFRTIFRMKMVPADMSVLDALTADELNYDVDAASGMMDTIFNQTEEQPLFQELYDHAAAKMFSLDRTIGMAVLFSYDYFAAFHRCLCVWLLEPSTWTATHPAFMTMLEKIK